MTTTTPHTCIKPQCHPGKCKDCSCAIAPNDDAAQLVLQLLNTFAVDGLDLPFEDGESKIVDRARAWLQNRPAPQQCLHQIAEPAIVLTEQDAVLLNQAIEQLEEFAAQQRQRGNCSSAEAAECSAHAVQRLGVAMLAAQRNGIPPAVPHQFCKTCNGYGLIGGPSFQDPGEGGAPCPDCTGEQKG
jgi:hypothetical protein